MGFPPEIYEIIMSIQATFFLSHEIRRNVELFLVFLADNMIIHYIGDELRYLGPDERSIGMLLMKALKKKDSLKNRRRIQSTPGIWVEKRNIQELLLKMGQRGQIIVVEKNSTEEIGEINQKELVLFIPNTEEMDVYREMYSTNLGISQLGIKDLPEKMRDFLTILKFYAHIDKISK